MRQKIQIGLVGGTGKMGREIQNLTLQGDTFNLAFSADRTFAGVKKCDVVIDFSTGGTEKTVEMCLKFQTPLVSGVTGLSRKEERLLVDASKKIPVFWSSNMSLGIAALKEALKSLQIIRDFNFSVDEWHHKNKKDSPSGTAKSLAKAIQESLDLEKVEIQSKRAGGIFGMHRVVAIGDHEYLELTHQALDRAVFAEGALKAAVWILNQEPGYYSMEDLLAKIKSSPLQNKRKSNGRK